MKKLIILLLFCNTVLAQNVVDGSTAKVNDETSKSQLKRTQQKNQVNDKYTDKYQYTNNNGVVICESIRGRRNHCVAETRYGVNFQRQLSSSSCDRNWGYDQSGIWVDNGCRAEFSSNPGWNQPGSEANIMICESHRYQRSYCRANLDGRDVFLLNQLSSTSCVNNWGYDRNGIWATNGCRAEFVIEDRYWTQNDIVVCSSRNLRFQGCNVDTRGGVEFIRQLSRATCNGNWGYDREGIWVTNGCRAKFKLMPFNQWNNGRNNSYNNTVKCSSKSLRRKTCQADTSGGVRLKKQHSRSPCRGNWGYTSNQIWVDNGCRATFQLHINGNQNHNGYNSNNNGYNNGNHNGYNNGNNGYNNPNNGYNNQPLPKTLICSSKKQRRKTCPISKGTRVTLKKQLSNSSCAGNWGYNSHEIWVDNGCRAQFKLY